MNKIRSILLVAVAAGLGGASLVTSTTAAEARFERIKSFAARGASFAVRGASSFAHRAVRPRFSTHLRPRPVVAQTPNGPIKVPCDFNCLKPKPKPPVVIVHRPPPVVVVQRPPHVHLPPRPVVVSSPTYVAPPTTYVQAAAYSRPAPAYVAPAAYTPPATAYAPPAPVAVPQADNCIVKQYTPDGQVMFIDKCTNEQAVAAATPEPEAPQQEEDADPQIQQR